MASAEAGDVTTLGTEEHELTEVATEAALRGRNGRLLVQTGGRYLVRAHSTLRTCTCRLLLCSCSHCHCGVLRLSLRTRTRCTLSMPPATTWVVHCWTLILKITALMARVLFARGIATRSVSALENVSIRIWAALRAARASSSGCTRWPEETAGSSYVWPRTQKRLSLTPMLSRRRHPLAAAAYAVVAQAAPPPVAACRRRGCALGRFSVPVPQAPAGRLSNLVMWRATL